MNWAQIFAIVGAIAIVAAVAVVLLKRWSEKSEKWESKIPPKRPVPPPDLQTEEMKPAEPEKKRPPILPPEKIVLPRPEQPKRK